MKNFTLRKKCPYSELFWSAFSRIWTEYGEILCISSYWIRMRENADQNNSKYGHFLRSVILFHYPKEDIWESLKQKDYSEQKYIFLN